MDRWKQAGYIENKHCYICGHMWPPVLVAGRRYDLGFSTGYLMRLCDDCYDQTMRLRGALYTIAGIAPTHETPEQIDTKRDRISINGGNDALSIYSPCFNGRPVDHYNGPDPIISIPPCEATAAPEVIEDE